jgi:hypothetical protein
MFAANSPSHLPPPEAHKPHPFQGIPSELAIGALVPPVLLGLLAARMLSDVMTQAGLMSEQLYRGERLPTLNVSASETEDE